MIRTALPTLFESDMIRVCQKLREHKKRADGDGEVGYSAGLHFAAELLESILDDYGLKV